jgi:hypothetical protein
MKIQIPKKRYGYQSKQSDSGSLASPQVAQKAGDKGRKGTVPTRRCSQSPKKPAPGDARDGVYGNMPSLYRFVRWVRLCAFKWLNRRGGKRKSFTWGKLGAILDNVMAKPCITEVKRRRYA